jgi:hypothetical protein
MDIKETEMNAEFQVHLLNPKGVEKAKGIAAAFDELLEKLFTLTSPEDKSVASVRSREMSIVRTKLEEACFFSKKSTANLKENQKAV